MKIFTPLLTVSLALCTLGCDDMSEPAPDVEYRWGYNDGCVGYRTGSTTLAIKAGRPGPEGDPVGPGWPLFVMENAKFVAENAIEFEAEQAGDAKVCHEVCARSRTRWLGEGCVNNVRVEMSDPFREIDADGRLQTAVEAYVDGEYGCACG